MKHKKLIGWSIAIAAILLLVGIYLLFDPTHSRWAPKCLFRLATGFDCPACGIQRSLHAALQGEFGIAFHYNPYAIIILPYLLVVAYTTFIHTPHALRWRNWVQHRYSMLLFLALTIGWWVVRNTPWWHVVWSDTFII